MQEFGEPLSAIDKTKDELILKEITIDNPQKSNQFKIELPFSLQYGDTYDIIVEKIGKKPNEKDTCSYGFVRWFFFDQVKVLTALDNDCKMLFFRIIKLSLDEKKKIELKTFLSQQNKNIKPDNSGSVRDILNNIPTNAWIERKEKGDDLFTTENIEEVDCLLKDYVQKLSDFTKQKKAALIYNSIKKLVFSLNKINIKSGMFIETQERERRTL